MQSNELFVNLPFRSLNKSHNAVFVASSLVIIMPAVFEKFYGRKSSDIKFSCNTGISEQIAKLYLQCCSYVQYLAQQNYFCIEVTHMKKKSNSF